MCRISAIPCVQKAVKLYNGFIDPTAFNKSTMADDVKILTRPCDCPPECEIQSYPSEITSGPFNRDFSINNLVFFKDVLIVNQSLVHVFFTDLITTRYRQDMFQNWLGVMAAFGGVLSLFLGYSMVSTFELIYFFTLRSFFDKVIEYNKKRETHH